MPAWLRSFPFVALGLAANCSVAELSLEGKSCPCAAGWTCDPATDRCVIGKPSVGGAAGDSGLGGSGSTGGVAGGGGVPTGGAGGGTKLCEVAVEDTLLTLTCPSGTFIDSIDFASYADAPGTCASPVNGSCFSGVSKSVVECHCLGHASCSIDADNAHFGDPCFQIEKSLLVQATCRDITDASAGGSGGTCGISTGGTGGVVIGGGAGGTTSGGGAGGTTSGGGAGGTTSGGAGGTTSGGGSGGTTSGGGSGGTTSGGGSGGTTSGGGTSGTAGADCGGIFCTGNTLCCAASTFSCTSPASACAGARVECDSPEDCSVGQVCCATLSESVITSLACSPSNKCTPDRIVCGADSSSCTGGLTCQTSSVPPYKICAP